MPAGGDGGNLEAALEKNKNIEKHTKSWLT